MPIANSTDLANIGKLYLFDGAAFNQIGKVYSNDGTSNYLIYTAEVAMPDLSTPEVYNYLAYNTTASSTSSGYWDLSGCDSLSLSWSLTTTMSWQNAYGLGSTTTVYLKLSDGTTIQLGTKSGTLWTAGTTYSASGTATVNLSGYTDAQLSKVYLYCTLGGMTASSPVANSDRHSAVASVTNVIAS